jgi:predicted GNAT superfamily acetyltransferase
MRSVPIMRIRTLTTLEEAAEVVRLEQAVWRYQAADEVVPATLLVVSARTGGILLGAEEEEGEGLVGFAYAFPAIRGGAFCLWSHMLGVIESHRDRGIGLALKLAQREHALAAGLDRIEWTFDPLQVANAQFNIARLGVVVEEFIEDAYGSSTSALHRGSPTDRFVASWRLATPHVERRLASGSIRVRSREVLDAVTVLGLREQDGWMHPDERPDPLASRRVLVQVPPRFADMQSSRPSLAVEWRLALRRACRHYLGAGYRVVDFFGEGATGGGAYLLARADTDGAGG